MENLKTLLSVIFCLVMFALILYLAYVTTKLIGKRYSVNGKSIKNLKILESISIGADRQLLIVKTCGKYLLLGATSHNVSLITELDKDELCEEINENNFQTMSFSDALKKVCTEKFSKKNDTLNEEEAHDDTQVGS